MKVRKTVEMACEARRRCPCFGVFCFLVALFASFFGAKSASADSPVAVLKSGALAVPATTLGLTNPYVVAAALERPAIEAPKGLGFTLSRDVLDLVHRVEKLAVHGVELNQRKLPQQEKLNLRVQSRLGGGVLQLCYRR
jgi:hypothetical protein